MLKFQWNIVVADMVNKIHAKQTPKGSPSFWFDGTLSRICCKVSQPCLRKASKSSSHCQSNDKTSIKNLWAHAVNKVSC